MKHQHKGKQSTSLESGRGLVVEPWLLVFGLAKSERTSVGHLHMDPPPVCACKATGEGRAGLAIGMWNIVTLAGKKRLGSGSQLLERGWTLSLFGIAQGERRRASLRILTRPWQYVSVLEFTKYQFRLLINRSLKSVLKGVPSGDSLVLLGDKYWVI